MKTVCLRWNRCPIHLNDKELAFSQLQGENFARRWSLCPQAVANSSVASTSPKLRFYSNPARGCNRASNNGCLFRACPVVLSQRKLVEITFILGKPQRTQIYIIPWDTLALKEITSVSKISKTSYASAKFHGPITRFVDLSCYQVT